MKGGEDSSSVSWDGWWAVPISLSLPWSKLYFTVILLIWLSDIDIFINRNFWNLFYHNNRTMCESGILLYVSGLNVEPTLFLQMGLWLWTDFQCNHAFSASSTLPGLQCQIIYSTILFVKVSWGVNQRDTVVTQKGKAPLHPLHLLITLKARELPFFKFLHDTSFPFHLLWKGLCFGKWLGELVFSLFLGLLTPFLFLFAPFTTFNSSWTLVFLISSLNA